MGVKKETSSIELREIIKELQFLIDSRLDKIAQSGNDFYLYFYVRAKGSFMLRVLPGKYLYLTEQKPKSTDANDFCLMLRKYLANTILKEISQLEPERIVKLELETKEKRLNLYIELFAKGNIILCDENGIIILLLERQEWKDRIVALKSKYEHPKKEINLFKAGIKDIERLRESEAESLVKALAIDLGLGGIYAEELCLIANIDKHTLPKKLADSEINAMYKSLTELLEKKPEPKVIMKDGKLVNIVPFDLEYYESCEFENKKSYNKALDEALSAEIAKEYRSEYNKSCQKNIGKINAIIEKQEKSLQEAMRTAEENQRKGEFIYENYALVKEILEELNKAKEKHSWEEIKKRLKGHKIIKSINEKEKKVAVEI